MAKKNSLSDKGFDSILDLVKAIDNSAEILSESKTAIINDYIDTGSYILNAAISGSVFKGIPAGRCTVFAGDPGTGKTYLALSACRNAQKKGYTPVYIDSEASIDVEFVRRLGCDPSNFIIKPVTTISEVSTFISRICKAESEKSPEERDKLIFVIDSLSNLTSDKEYTDTVEGNQKRDMTKQQEVKALFRTNATSIGNLGYPMIVCAHIYKTLDLYAKTVVSGGCLTPDSLIITKKGIVPISEIKVGDFVKDSEGYFSKVLETFKFKKNTFTFTFEDNTKISCSNDHKFLVWDDEHTVCDWKKAKDINENSSVLSIDNFNNYTEKKIIKKRDGKMQEVCDLCVDLSHTYVSENGVINHNSGLNFNSSVTMLLSTAKLDDKESEKIAESKTGDFVKTGVIVTAKAEKSRFTIPQKVKFQIPFFKSPNPYIGLEAYLTWENSGIIRGEILSDKDYEKLQPKEQKQCKEMTDVDGNKCYAIERERSTKLVVKHLHKEVPIGELYSSSVITDDILKSLDNDIIKPNFELPSNESDVDIEEALIEMENNSSENNVEEKKETKEEVSQKKTRKNGNSNK